MSSIRFNLNGAWVELREVAPTQTLLRWLRDERGLTGTKEGCAEGDCGACTVAVAEPQPDGQQAWRAVNACLLLLPMLQGKHVRTVEALRTDAPHPAQAALTEALGSQCGYCTPGVVMTMFEATYRGDLDQSWKLDDQLAGNLCRCTGYRPIREAAQRVAGTRPDDEFQRTLKEPAGSMQLAYEHGGQRFTTPVTFDALFDELDAHPDARFVNGGTDLGLEITKRFETPKKLISLEGLRELGVLAQGSTGFTLGAGATISELEAFTATRLPAVHRMVRYFGARQVKHRGTIGGNLCTASPIGDLAPVLLALGGVAVLRSRKGERRVALSDFFLGYRKTALQPGEVLAAVEVPTPHADARTCAYKVSKRRELDISTVSAGFLVEVDAGNRVKAARLAFGGMAATPTRVPTAEAALVGQPWSPASVELAVQQLEATLKPLSDHRGSAEYRRTVASNLLRGFYEETLVDHHPAFRPGHAATVQP
jgi:xanthine dehydrogenase small subunit